MEMSRSIIDKDWKLNAGLLGGLAGQRLQSTYSLAAPSELSNIKASFSLAEGSLFTT